MKFFIKTLGCKQNHYETNFLYERFIEKGHEYSEKNPDIVILHSCAVTNKAEYKSRDYFKRLKKRYPNAKLYAIGCSAQYHKKKYYELGAYKVLDNHEKMVLDNYELKDVVGDFTDINSEKIKQFPLQTRAFLSIQNGCDLNCAYCIITKLRGKSYSKDLKTILEEIKMLIENGNKEIVFTGINLGLWGKEWNKKLYNLLEEIQIFKHIRFRLSSLNVNNIDKPIMDFIIEKNNNIMPHLHISLQSGSNKILALHRRPYTVEQFIEITHYIKERNPLVNIGIDIIAGLPGEKEEDFNLTIENLKKAKIDYMHIFPYSKRENTDAIKFNLVNGNKIIERKNILHQMDHKLRKKFRLKNLNIPNRILIERKNQNGFYTGLSDNYIQYALKKGQINHYYIAKGYKIEEDIIYG